MNFLQIYYQKKLLKVILNKKKIILGVSALYHDSSAVLLIDSKISAACHEERFTRIKFDNSFPINSINYCLKNANISEDDIDIIIFYENPDLKLDRLIKTFSFYRPLKIFKNFKIIKNWLRSKYNFNNFINKYLPNFKGKILYSEHHLSHASSAFYPSPYEESAILVVDGVGEWASSSIAFGKGNKIKIIKQQNFPNSIGILYSAFTRYLGFKVLSGEYKLMGLAPYGEPKYQNIIEKEIVKINDDGSIVLNQSYFDFLDENKIFNSKFDDLFNNCLRKPKETILEKHCDIAASIQKITEKILIKMSIYACKITSSKNLCLAGGVALNCVANGKILKQEGIENLWIQPASGDAGCALGAACYYLFNELNTQRDFNNNFQQNSYLGPKYENHEIKHYLESYSFNFKQYDLNQSLEIISQSLQEGKVVGLFHSNMEFGPRALGNRSIVGDPRIKDMQKKMNLKIKFRESFRPFAPAVLESQLSKWFKFDEPSPYMLITAEVKDDIRVDNSRGVNTSGGLKNINEVRSSLPAITHIDYSARIQSVKDSNDTIFTKILKKFYVDTGCPVLINTSFNIRSEPIVSSPYDALRCFMNTDMDLLFIGDFILFKEKQNNSLKDENFKNSFELD